jgi:classical protein kinase C/novel protein kinase C epsilon type
MPAPQPTVSMPAAHPSRPYEQQQPPRQQQQQQQMVPAQQQQQKVSQRKRKIGLDDFNFLAVLGKGNFGKVMLAEERMTSNLYAIKVLKKEFIIENDEVESTQSEKRVFLAAAEERHPFLLGLHSCFQTETRVYFVMEYISGGDLMLHIQRKQFTLRQAKFYACEVLLALQYFHSKGIIYRDLKLDNILLTLDGHVKVADYGLCKEEMWHGRTTTTFCGTPEFMAPEILQEQPYGRAVDWWAFGVLTYEMLLGQSPFRGDDEDEIFDAIIEDEPLYPITMPRDAVSLLQRVSSDALNQLTPAPDTRPHPPPRRRRERRRGDQAPPVLRRCQLRRRVQQAHPAAVLPLDRQRDRHVQLRPGVHARAAHPHARPHAAYRQGPGRVCRLQLDRPLGHGAVSAVPNTFLTCCTRTG